MPAHKRSLSVNATDEDSVRRRHQYHHAKQSKVEDQEVEQTSEEEEEEETEQAQKKRIVVGHNDEDAEDEAEEKEEREDSEGSPSSSSGDKPEYVYVDLADVRKEVQCPICLGIIKKTRTVMECLHRFCRECIDKSMRLGNNECPACRTHCASRRSLRDDPNFDALIAVLYPDIDKYEEEELAFHAEEKARNKQIQESIAEIVQRQSEACSKRRNAGKDPVSGQMTRPHRNARIPLARRKRKTRETQESDDNEDENGNFGGAKDSSSGDELIAQSRPKKQKRRTVARSSLPSSVENDTDVATRETRAISPALNTEMFGWGRGGTRSNTRHGASTSSGKVSRNTRIAKLVEHIRNMEEKNNEMDVHFMLLSLDKGSMPSLKRPYICSRPSLSIGNLREYIAQQTHLQPQEVEILVVKSHSKANNNSQVDRAVEEYEMVFPDIEEMCPLEAEDTLARIRASYLPTMTSHLVLGYQQKKTTTVS